jgi:hypothetical protein
MRLEDLGYTDIIYQSRTWRSIPETVFRALRPVTFQKTARAALGLGSSSLVRWISYQTVSSQSESRASYTSGCEMGISETSEVS